MGQEEGIFFLAKTFALGIVGGALFERKSGRKLYRPTVIFICSMLSYAAGNTEYMLSNFLDYDQELTAVTGTSFSPI
jgi:hypothetical protein